MSGAAENNQGGSSSNGTARPQLTQVVFRMPIISNHPFHGFQQWEREVILNYGPDGQLVSVDDPTWPGGRAQSPRRWAMNYAAMVDNNERNWSISTGQRPYFDPEPEVDPVPTTPPVARTRRSSI